VCRTWDLRFLPQSTRQPLRKARVRLASVPWRGQGNARRHNCSPCDIHRGPCRHIRGAIRTPARTRKSVVRDGGLDDEHGRARPSANDSASSSSYAPRGWPFTGVSAHRGLTSDGTVPLSGDRARAHASQRGHVSLAFFACATNHLGLGVATLIEDRNVTYHRRVTSTQLRVTPAPRHPARMDRYVRGNHHRTHNPMRLG
jgi:hypothetical protein